MASRKVRLINQLTHTKGPFAGESFHLRRWQERDIIRPLFTTGSDGRRRYRTCLLMMPRKNGKTELAAALAIDGLIFDGEIGGEIYSAAADKEQAALVFNVAAQMIRNDAELYAACDVLDSQKRIVHGRAAPCIARSQPRRTAEHGFNASRVIYDELHAAPDRELWDVLATSTGGRDQPLVVAISTAGYDRHSILWELYAHAKKVLADPTLDPTFLSVIYEAPREAEWTDRAVWKLANPALGDFRSLEEMEIMCARAQKFPPRKYLPPLVSQSMDGAGVSVADARLVGCVRGRRGARGAGASALLRRHGPVVDARLDGARGGLPDGRWDLPGARALLHSRVDSGEPERTTASPSTTG